MSDRVMQAMLLGLLLILPLSALAARRLPWKRTATYAAAWGGVFLLLFLIITTFT